MANNAIQSLSIQNTLMFELGIASLLIAIGIAIGKRRLTEWVIAVPKRPALVLLGIAVVSHFPYTTEPLWYDELYTQLVARLPIQGILTAAAGDVHPPLFYLLEAAMTHVFGDTPFVLRLISFGCMVACTPAVFLMFERSIGQQKAFIAALLFNFTYAATYYSQESRMYAPLTLCILWFIGFSQRDDRKLAMVGLTVLAVWLHNLAWLYFGLLWAGYLISVVLFNVRIRQYVEGTPREWRPAIWWTFHENWKAVGLLIIALAPRIPGLIAQLSYTSSGEFWAAKLSATGVNTAPGYFIDAARILSVGSRIDPYLTIFITLAAFTATIYAFIQAAIAIRRHGVIPDLWFVVPLLACPVLIAVGLPLEYLYRFFIPVVAVGGAALACLNLRVLRIAVVVCLGIAYLSFYFPHQTSGRYDYGKALADLPSGPMGVTEKDSPIILFGATEETILAGNALQGKTATLDDLPGTFSHATMDAMRLPYLTVEQACQRSTNVQILNMNFEGTHFLNPILAKWNAESIYHAIEKPIVIDLFQVDCTKGSGK